jgi:hypothetical protein
VTIPDGIVKGEMPQRALKMIFDWLDIHRDELMIDWALAQNRSKLNKIEPLKELLMFLEIINAKYLNDYKIFLEFNDGVSMTVDLANELEGEIFEPLKNKDYFKTFFIKFNTIEWDNGADIAPEHLYQIGKKTDKPQHAL